MSLPQTTLGPSVSEGVFSQPRQPRPPGQGLSLPSTPGTTPTLPPEDGALSSPRAQLKSAVCVTGDTFSSGGRGGAGRRERGEFLQAGAFQRETWLVQAA